MSGTGRKIPTAAYCRVSTKSDLQDGSFEVQCAYYEKLITESPDMELVGIYGDHGKSGRSMENRDELQQLLDDCRAGKVKLILCKSISRFARNMLECVDTIRKLRDMGVVVRFEREGISTDNMGGELMLGILATIAQEESNSISQNMNWSRQKHVERGEPWDVPRYGYVSEGKEHRWVIVPHEKEVVQKAFFMAGICYTTPEIMAEMNRMEEEAGTGKVWNRTPIRNLLTSEVYLGNYLSNKECTIIGKNGKPKRVKNKGYVDQILIEGHHEPMVSRELFDAVQELVKNGLLSAARSKFSASDEAIKDRAMRAAAKEASVWQ